MMGKTSKPMLEENNNNFRSVIVVEKLNHWLNINALSWAIFIFF